MLEGLTIEYILLILVCFIMLASILIGLIHGFKKSMFKLVATIVFWVIFWVSAPFIKFRFLLQKYNDNSKTLCYTFICINLSFY